MAEEKKELNLSDLGTGEETESKGNVNDGSVKVISAEDIPVRQYLLRRAQSRRECL